ncbi:MAG: glycosyl transferase [Lachnospira sp.]|jgi:UDP-N-acetylglucosamine transferase subunit ALG13|nr:glycosyl transferase [Lachnospira sp.]
MIFVILGTQKFQLNRLLKALDKLCENKTITEEIFAQIGHSNYHPKNYLYTNFLDRLVFEKKMKDSSLVITHGGVGSIITAINEKKPIIVFPRLKKYKEHVDDHQLEIARAFSKKNYVLCCEHTIDLEKMIEKAYQHQFDIYVSSTEKIVAIVKNALEG